MKRKVFCKGCDNLFYINDGQSPQCVATAVFVEGPLRPRIDVVGRDIAERKNVDNDCRDRRIFSLHARAIKKWMLWRMNDGSSQEESYNESGLGDVGSEYSVGKEEARAKAYKKEKGNRTAFEVRRRSTENSEENVVDDGGIGDSDVAESSSEERDQHLFDFGLDEG